MVYISEDKATDSESLVYRTDTDVIVVVHLCTSNCYILQILVTKEDESSDQWFSF